MRRAATILFAGGLLGKGIGFLREIVLAALFGAGRVVDAYRAALTATLVPVNVFASDTLSAGFIPLYVRYRDEDPDRADALFWSLATLLLFTASALSLGLFALAPVWTALLVPGFDAAAKDLTTSMIRVTAVGIPFYVASTLIVYLEIGHGRYALASLRATVQSLGLIAGAVAAFLMQAPQLLAWGFTAAYAVFLVIGLMRAVRGGSLVPAKRPRRLLSRPVLAEFWRVARPLLVLPLFLQGNIVVERIVASVLGTGVLASLEYARTVTETGLALVAVPLGLAGLSELGRLDERAMRERLASLLRLLGLIFLPLSAFLAVHARDVVEALFARGAFQADATATTTGILVGLAAGFWAHVASYVLVKALSSHRRNVRAVAVLAAGLATNVVANLLLHPALGPAALGVAASLNAIVTLLLALRALRLLKRAARENLPLLLGVPAYLAVAVALAGWTDGAFGLAVAAMAMGFFWTAVGALSPLHRGTVAAALRQRDRKGGTKP